MRVFKNRNDVCGPSCFNLGVLFPVGKTMNDPSVLAAMTCSTMAAMTCSTNYRKATQNSILKSTVVVLSKASIDTALLILARMALSAARHANAFRETCKCVPTIAGKIHLGCSSAQPLLPHLHPRACPMAAAQGHARALKRRQDRSLKAEMIHASDHCDLLRYSSRDCLVSAAVLWLAKEQTKVAAIAVLSVVAVVS